MMQEKKYINLCSFGHPEIQAPGVFDDTIYSFANLVRLCGAFPVIRRNKIDSENLNIIWGAGVHYSPSMNDLLAQCSRANTIFFNMEQISSDSPLVTRDYIEFLANFKIFDYSIHNIKALRKYYPLINADEFPIIPSPSFCYDHSNNINEKKYHYAFYGAMNERRRYILEKMQSKGLSVKIINNAYGANLSKELCECRAVINIHAYESSLFETARVLRPIAMGIPIISEKSLMPQLIDWEQAPIKFVEYDDLVNYCIENAEGDFNVLNKKNFITQEFFYNYYRNPALFKSIRYLLGIVQ